VWPKDLNLVPILINSPFSLLSLKCSCLLSILKHGPSTRLSTCYVKPIGHLSCLLLKLVLLIPLGVPSSYICNRGLLFNGSFRTLYIIGPLLKPVETAPLYKLRIALLPADNTVIIEGFIILSLDPSLAPYST
jgi:hypothetical protein